MKVEPVERIQRARNEVGAAMERAWRLRQGAPDELAGALERVAETIRLHAGEAEAPGGLFAQLLEMAPRLAPQVADLRQAHGEFLQLIEETRQKVQSGAREEALSLLKDLRTRLMEHRRQSYQLVYDAFDVELGGGD